MKYLLIIVTSLVCCYISINEAQYVFSARVLVTSLFIQVFSTYHIFAEDATPYSLHKIFYLFTLFFFGIAPLLQFYNETYFYGLRLLREYEYFYLNILIAFILILYQLIYKWFRRVKFRRVTANYLDKFVLKQKLNNKQVFVLFIISIFSFLMLLYNNNFSLLSMLVRGGEIKEQAQNTAIQDLIITQFFRPMSMMSFLYYALSPRRNRVIFFVLGMLALLTCFPSGMPRFNVAALYIPVAILLIPVFRRKYVFSVFFIFCLLLLFPFLNNFRTLSSGTELEVGFDFEMFTQAHFDSYNNFGLIVFENIVTYGRQLLGVLLFWMPRSVWPDKPIGSGAFVAEKLNFSFTNVSANFFAEGYVNFGLVGILIFVIAIAYFTARMDIFYWAYLVKQPNNFFKVIYLIMIGLVFFVLRGDLMSSFAFTCGYLFSIIVIFKLTSLFRGNAA